MPAHPSRSDLDGALKGAEFPARRLELYQQAQDNGVPQRMLVLIRALPPKRYADLDQVVTALDAFRPRDLSA